MVLNIVMEEADIKTAIGLWMRQCYPQLPPGEYDVLVSCEGKVVEGKGLKFTLILKVAPRR